jgi:hypothetical protein
MKQPVAFLYTLLFSNLSFPIGQLLPYTPTPRDVQGLSKKYPTLFSPGKTSDGRLANLITVVVVVVGGGPS